MFRPNRLKARIRAGEKTLGTWLQSGTATFAEIAAAAGFDAIVMDQEHGTGDLQEAIDLMRAASGGAASFISRVPSSDPVFLRRLIDGGVDGIIVPMVESGEQAKHIVDACRYPPRGMRGNAWDITRASSYGFAPDYYQRADENLLIILQIETAKGVEKASEIASVDGVDMIFIGPTDLSGSIGLANQTGAPEVEALIDRACAATRAAGKPLATVPRIGRTWQQLLDEGFLLVATGSEIYYYREAVKRLREDWRTYSGEGAAATAAGKGGYGG